MGMPPGPDWNLIRAFLAVAEAGSLSGAARRLGLSQPTLGRQVQALEEQLGATLFHRRPRGLDLAEAGLDLIGPARAMQAAAADLALAAAGSDRGLAGTVRVTASAMTACHHLPPILARLRRETPEIRIELVASDATDNLLFREADIAVRMYRPEQLEVVTKHLGDVELGLYAARSYLDRVGRPQSLDEAMALDVIGFDRNEEIIRGMGAMGLAVGRDFFALRCDDNMACHALLCAGCGLGFAQVSVAGRDAALERLLPDLPLPHLPVWLSSTRPALRSRRVRRVLEALEAGLRPHLLPPASA